MYVALRNGVTFCDTSDRLIFLDLPADAYFCLSNAAETAFRTICGSSANLESLPPAARTLLERNVLVETAVKTVIAPVSASPSPTESLMDEIAKGILPIMSIAAAAVELRRAQSSLEHRGLAPTLSRLRGVKAHLTVWPGEAARLTASARAFELLTRFISPLDQCLPRAIAQTSLLLRRGMDARLMIGVKLRPFLAHSWVETPTRLVNERYDVVRNFVPILVI